MVSMRTIGLRATMIWLFAAPGWAQTVPPPSAESAAAPVGRLQRAEDGWRISSIVGVTVYNDKNQSIGVVDDLIIGPDKTVSQAVLSVGGFLGIGARLIAVPFDQLHFSQTSLRAAGAPAAVTPGTLPANPGGSNPVSTRGGPLFIAPPAAGKPPPLPAPTSPMVMRLELPGATKKSLLSMKPFSYTGG